MAIYESLCPNIFFNLTLIDTQQNWSILYVMQTYCRGGECFWGVYAEIKTAGP